MTPDPITLFAALNQNFKLFRGEDKVLSIDMTGYDLTTAIAFEWWLAKSVFADISTPGDVLIQKAKDAGITVSDTKLEIPLDGADTVDIKPELYYHELKITLADGTSKVAMAGNVVIMMSLKMEATP
jgi:hypothetical protein